ncbi:MAG TPA: hypothetical protein VGO21_04365 [Candidatus Paceibacterota bacterium]|nr:hypothetical protein [Candidatus Paceibacterota bacterium]
MEEKLIKIFNNTKYEPSEDIAQSSWCAVVLADKRTTRFKLWAFSLFGFFSLIGFIPVWKMLSDDLAHSGFFEYLSVAFSGGSIALYWKELGFSILESLPMTSIIVTLTLIFIFFLSIKYTMKQIIRTPLSLSF